MVLSDRVELRRGISYAELDQRQREIAAEVRLGAPGKLLLTEVRPVITRGRRAPREAALLLPESMLQAQGVEVYLTDRGGLDTYHGPGQWVLFAVDRLEALTGDSRGVRRAVEGLLESALEVAREYDPKAEIRSGAETGVWTPRGKVGAVGVHIERGVLLHGLALNGFRTATSFVGLRPCGLDAPIDFLLEGPGRPGMAGFEAMGEKLCQAILGRFWGDGAGRKKSLETPLTNPGVLG